MTTDWTNNNQRSPEKVVKSGNLKVGTEFANRFYDKLKGEIMSEENKAEINVDLPRKPLEPVGDRVSDEQRAAYAKLLAEYERISKMHTGLTIGASFKSDKGDGSCTVEAYNAELAAYRKARAEYNRRFADSVETIDMVRAKIKRMQVEDEQYEKEHPDVECPEPPELEDIPDEPWDDFKKRFEEFNNKLRDWNEQLAKNHERMTQAGNRLCARMAEIGKFPQLEYELEMRFRHTYIDPKTGEHFYRPDDDVGEGLICFGSRDYTPVLKDE